MDYRIKCSPRRIRPALSVSGGVVTLHLPEIYPADLPDKLIASNRLLIEQMLQKERMRAAPFEPDFRIGALFPMQGKMYPVTPGAGKMPEFAGDGFQVTTSAPLLLRRQMRQIYFNRAAEVISRKAYILATRNHLRYSELKFNSAETRWGSCTGGGVINFSWKLVLCADELIEYVVAHELAHLRQMNHSAQFWQEVGNIFPSYRERRAELRREGERYRRFNLPL